MKPKHELPRTPIHQNNETMSSNVSNSSVTTSIISVKEVIPQIPAGILRYISIINKLIYWDKH